MKKLLLVLLTAALATTFALAQPQSAILTQVRATHQRAQRHHAHKATRHHTPKRHHRTI